MEEADEDVWNEETCHACVMEERREKRKRDLATTCNRQKNTGEAMREQQQRTGSR